MITEQSLRDDPALVKAWTGLPADVFWALVRQMTNHRSPDNPDRATSPTGVGHPYTHPLVLRIAAVLTYLRTHLTQTAAARPFGLRQDDISRDLRRLLPTIQTYLPCPAVWTLDEAEPDMLAIPPQPDADAPLRVLVDATEQRVSRPSDPLIQADYYSGKKKGHTLKTQLVTDADHHILAISEAVPGALHDKTVADRVGTITRLPDDTELDADKGYQGLANGVPLLTICDPISGARAQVPRVRVLTPVKKPPGGELAEADQTYNAILGALRVRIEHCLGWVKNWAILTTRFRCCHTLYTSVMQTVCGLVNAQTERWQAKKRAQANCA